MNTNSERDPATGRLLRRPDNAGRKPGTAERDKIRELIQPHREAIIAFLVGALTGAVDPGAIKQASDLLQRLERSGTADDATIQAASELLTQLTTRGTADAAGVKAAAELLDRLSAKPKASGERVHIPGLREAPTIEAKADLIIQAVGDGEISVEAGRQALGMLADYARAKTVDDHEQRLRMIEAAQNGKQTPRMIATLPSEDLV